MTATVLVEPDPGGHRFQTVAMVARLARTRGDVVLLTSRGATATDAFANFLGPLVAAGDLEVDECFDAIYPPTAAMLAETARVGATRPLGHVVVMDADQSLKRWWLLAPRVLRTLHPRPRVVFMLTRYPARLHPLDRTGWKLRVSKALLALAAMATGSLHRVAGFAGRDDAARGWLVKRATDPAVCSAHSRDRAVLRRELDLPADVPVVGIYGVVSERKNAPFVLDAIEASGTGAVLLLAGKLDPDVRAWADGLPPGRRERVVVRDAFHPDDVLDRYVAAADAVALPLTNNGPSGIMGKALAAGVPVVSAGSLVRERELRATGGGEAARLEVGDFAAALRRALERGPRPVSDQARSATPEAYAATILGWPEAVPVAGGAP